MVAINSQGQVAASNGNVEQEAGVHSLHTNGTAKNGSATGPAVELSAAAEFLETFTSRSGLKSEVDCDIQNDNSTAATKKLADAFVLALGQTSDSAVITADLEGCMQVLLLWLKECNMQDQLVSDIAKGLSSSNSNAELKLKFIALMYNAVGEENGKLRFRLLLDIIQLAASAGMVPKIVDTVMPSVDRFLKQWDVSLDDRRKMYKTCYDALRSAHMVSKAFAFNVKQIELYNGSSEEDLQAVQDDVVQAITDAVRLPKLYRFDTLLELSAVRRLGNEELSSPENELGLLFELLNIFVKDGLDSFLDFAEKHETFLNSMDIDRKSAEEKMRLLTFASLGIEAQELSYGAIATALKISDSQVEDWVIRAISSGLVDAKINQLRSSVSIYRSTQRMFTREEWQPLSERINTWKDNIGGLLTALRETRQSSTRAAVEVLSSATS